MLHVSARMKRYSLFVGLLFFCITTVAQVTQKYFFELPYAGDTLYIGVSNKVRLDKKPGKILEAKADYTRVQIKEDELILMPGNNPGEITFTLTYKDTIIKRKFHLTYLPKPSSIR